MTVKAGPGLSLESRTRMVWSVAIRFATSTQLPVPSLLYEDLNHAASGAIAVDGM